MNNSVFGKNIKILRNWSKNNLVISEVKLSKFGAKILYKAFTIFREKLVIVEKIFVKLLQNRPIQVGFVILDVNQ